MRNRVFQIYRTCGPDRQRHAILHSILIVTAAKGLCKLKGMPGLTSWPRFYLIYPETPFLILRALFPVKKENYCEPTSTV